MRLLLGWILLAHALAHASAAAFTPIASPAWLYALCLALAFAGYFSSGLAVLRMPVLRRYWKGILLTGSTASVILLVWTRPRWGILGVALDIGLLVAAEAVMQPRIDAAIEVREVLGSDASAHPWWVRAGWTIGAVFLVYGAAVLIAHPVVMRWGSTPDDRAAALPGDDVLPRDAAYRIDHAITIHASARAVWPWLVQLGQDRGGFYSYDWLERAVGDRISNADRVHAEWQARAVGDTIFATQRDYLGGRFGALGWTINVLEPERVIGLERWGNFVLRPIDSTTTRLIVRTRGTTAPTFTAFLLAPVSVFAFEPAHFIMERAMLRGIRDRVEASIRETSG